MGKLFSGVGTFTVEGENAVLGGINSFGGGEFNELKVLGVNAITGKVKVNELKIEGICNTKASVETNKLILQGVVNAGGDLRAHEAEISGMLSMGDSRFEADRISCKGMIQTKGEINADELVADGSIQGSEIFGDRVVIHTENIGYDLYSGLKWKLKGQDSKCGSKVKTIEATEIDLINVEAESVSGKNITIGKGCHIDCVDCSGMLSIDPTATVKAVTGNYTRVDEPAAEETVTEEMPEEVTEDTEEENAEGTTGEVCGETEEDTPAESAEELSGDAVTPDPSDTPMD